MSIGFGYARLSVTAVLEVYVALFITVIVPCGPLLST